MLPDGENGRRGLRARSGTINTAVVRGRRCGLNTSPARDSRVRIASTVDEPTRDSLGRISVSIAAHAGIRPQCRRHFAASRCTGRHVHVPAGRQRRGCRPGRGGRIDGNRAVQQRPGVGCVRHGLGRRTAAWIERFRPVAPRVAGRQLPGPRSDRHGLGFDYRARLCGCVVRVVPAVRRSGFRSSARAGNPLRRGRLGRAADRAGPVGRCAGNLPGVRRFQ